MKFKEFYSNSLDEKSLEEMNIKISELGLKKIKYGLYENLEKETFRWNEKSKSFDKIPRRK